MKRTLHEAAFRLAFDMQTQMADKVGDFGVELTPLKMRILRVIWSASTNNVSAQDIVKTVKRDKAQVARIIEDLCAQGLVRREVDPSDRRSKILFLTDQGAAIFASVEEIEATFAAALTRGIDRSDLAAFFRVADKISENLKEM